MTETTCPAKGTELFYIDPEVVLCEARQRQDLGDIDTLAQSIFDMGQLQPILITSDNRLVAGGRRLAACKQLKIRVLAVRSDRLPPEDLEMLELEENIRRKSLSWQEETIAVARIHRKHRNDASRRCEKWLPRFTGALLGVSQASVYNALAVAERLERKDEEMWKCTGVTDALQLLLRRKARLAESRLVSMTSEDEEAPEEGEASGRVVTASLTKAKATLRKLTIVHGTALKWLDAQPDRSVSTIYTDPPYAIDMANFQQDGGGMRMENVAATHIVEDNLTELRSFIPLAARKLSGFLVLWCDVWHFRTLAELCDANGLNVQRWPITWVKTSICQNMAASYNFTKSTEVALVARVHKTTLNAPVGKCHYICDNVKPEWPTNPFFKPIELHTFILKAIAIPGTTVVDPYGGCGSIPLACITNCWDAVMVETDQTHIAAFQHHLSTL